MAVMMPREKWTDERLDDLNVKVDRGFAETKAEMRESFAETKAEMRESFADTKADMRAGFTRVDAEIRELRSEINARFDAMNRSFLAGLVTVIAAVIGSHAL